MDPVVDSSVGQEFRSVETNDELALACAEWRLADTLAIDTEFMRTNTFYAKLGLLQVRADESTWLVDPLEIEDWGPFKRLCEEGECEFVLHSCSEDLSVFLSHFGFLPARIFDTQLAASFLGMGPSLSYASLVEQSFGVIVDKDATRTDWLQRPLAEKQLRYAAIDVLHLLELREMLCAELRARGLLAFFTAECATLLDAAASAEAPENWAEAYLGIGNAWRLDSAGLRVLRALAHWRERVARSRDKPRSWIVKDADLYEFAQAAAKVLNQGTKPLSCDALSASGALRQVDGQFLSRNAKALDALLEDLAATQTEEPLSPAGPITRQARDELKSLRRCADDVAHRAGIGSEALARKRHLLAFLEVNSPTGEEQRWPTEIAEWKRDLFGDELWAALGSARAGGS